MGGRPPGGEDDDICEGRAARGATRQTGMLAQNPPPAGAA